MRTLEPKPAQSRLRRDARLLWRMIAMLVGYWTVGARLRLAYRMKEARGEVFWVDDEGPTHHREASLHRR